MSHAFEQKIQSRRLRVEQVLNLWLGSASGKPSNTTALASDIAPTLVDAMRYSLLNGGKRLRPILAYAVGEALGLSFKKQHDQMDCVAAAIECVHSYSLVHDDLPAMDDDDLRRGKPTCHIAFDEATAILAGDALLTLAFEKLSALDDAPLAISLIRELSAASGASGMVGGQALDLEAEGAGENIHLQSLQKIHKYKTGALIRASVRMGALVAHATESQMSALTQYAESIGLAFQVQDDIIDVSSDTQTLGKPQGSDLKQNKSTYVSLLGVAGAKEKAELLISDAKKALMALPQNDNLLGQIADYVIDRRN